MQDFVTTAIETTADLGMILGPCLGYIMQTVTMVQTNEADGFSTLVSFILLVSNLIRVFWWYAERFSLVIFIAALVMIMCQCALIYMWVKIQNRPNTDKSEKPFVESFWHWKQFNSYLVTIGSITAFLTVITFFGHEKAWFRIVLGTLSSGIEALLGVPQFWLNCKRQHTHGLAISLIGMWFFGDLYKMSYYQSTGSPLQLVLCAFFQCSTDCAILSQFWFYRLKNAEMVETMKANNDRPRVQRINDLLAQATALTSMGPDAAEIDTMFTPRGYRSDSEQAESPRELALKDLTNNALHRRSADVERSDDVLAVKLQKAGSIDMLGGGDPSPMGGVDHDDVSLGGDSNSTALFDHGNTSMLGFISTEGRNSPAKSQNTGNFIDELKNSEHSNRSNVTNLSQYER